jgi:hypothetical protein
LAIAALALTAGCGSTVQTAGTAAVSSDGGLAAPTSSASAAPGAVPGAGGLSVPAAGTGSAPAGGSSAATTGTGVQPGVAPGGSVAANGPAALQGPIKIGIVLTKVSNAAEFGVSLGNTYAEKDFDQALINALNKHGGIDGRRIDPIYASTDTATTNWSTDFEAACATFTQDNHVAAVLGYAFDYERNFESCLAKNGIPHLTTAFNVPDNAELSQWPLFWALETPTIDVRSLAKIQGAMRTGVLTSKSKLGVILDSCPGTVHAWTTVIQPYLRRMNINVADVQNFGCGTGDNASEGNEVSQAGNAMVAFRSKGVDRVTFFSVSEGPALLVLSEAAESQHYYPKWIVSSLANLSVLVGQAPRDQLQNVEGYGWLETQDVSPSQYSKPNAAQRRCLSLMKSQGVVPKSAADFSFAYNICEAVFVYEQALVRTGGSSIGTSIIAGVARIGDFLSTLNYAGESSFTSSRRNNTPRVYRHVVYLDPCSCFKYVGGTMAMPS